MSSRDTKHAGHDAKLFTTSIRRASMATPAAGIDLGRRRILAVTAAGSTLAILGAPSLIRAQSGPKFRIGYWPVAAGLPFFVALEKGFFKEAGLDVEGLKFAGAQQVMEAREDL